MSQVEKATCKKDSKLSRQKEYIQRFKSWNNEKENRKKKESKITPFKPGGIAISMANQNNDLKLTNLASKSEQFNPPEGLKYHLAEKVSH